MRQKTSFALITGMSLFALGGCGSTSTEPADSSSSVATDNHGEHAHDDAASGGQSDMEKMKAELAKLSAEDAASAEKQHVCLVSGKMLGTMGAPQKVDVSGQTVWICCGGCKEQLLENPDQYLAKLNSR